MRAIINGVEGGRIGLYKGGAEVLNIRLINDDGSTLALTGGTVTVKVHDTKDRRNAATFSKAATLSVAAFGVVTLTLLATDMTFGPSTNDVPYYMFVEFVSSGTVTSVGLTPTEIIIK